MDATTVIVGLGGPAIALCGAYISHRYQRDLRARIRADQEIIAAEKHQDSMGVYSLQRSVDLRLIALGYYEHRGAFSRFYRLPLKLGLIYLAAAVVLAFVGFGIDLAALRTLAVVWSVLLVVWTFGSFRQFAIAKRENDEHVTKVTDPVAEFWRKQLGTKLD